MKKQVLFFAIFLAIFCFVFSVQKVSAYTIEKLNFSNEGDIVVGPGKTELSLDPGSSATQEIIVSNRSGMQKIINIGVEDFRGSRDPNETVQFLGNVNGPYSLKDYVKPEVNQITLNFGERLRLPITISIPKNTSPGGLYGAVMISAVNIDEINNGSPNNAAAGKVKIITRVASLFFIRVNGKVVNNGNLKDFKTEKSLYESGPITFKILSENNGSVYLSPYGVIEIKNMLGQQIDERQIDPWFVMPDSLRERDVVWNNNFLFGRYTATISMNRGYDNIIDSKSFAFWVIPWRIISIILIGLILIIWLFIWILSHLQWKRGQKTEIPPPPVNIPTKSPPAGNPPPVTPGVTSNPTIGSPDDNIKSNV